MWRCTDFTALKNPKLLSGVAAKSPSGDSGVKSQRKIYFPDAQKIANNISRNPVNGLSYTAKSLNFHISKFSNFQIFKFIYYGHLVFM